ncbi:hypothetical protein [Nonomuraea gerenzanensis]|uniref:Uncharacterized protein n=1 Tax=Nonomuraea gerenzanensis TaxID=93944 RepID=A0A1M4E5F2_9ACTN|nr:hypothetical protein [Nonomuraea gerenzanensis]UBU16243.1 hypothetical protein LCN96_14875 [Nonomuraea gerenzanensis]SBO94057.1 hypothetical protein BN4615_P3573 [Nonomuraea gerenzanensis]
MPAPKHIQTALAPDGRRVTLSCRSENVQGDWQWQMRLTSKTIAVGLGVAGPGYADGAMAALKMSVRQQIVYRAQPLVVMVDAAEESWMAAWKGPHHTLHLGGAAPAPDLGTITGLLDQLSITDTPDGLLVTPQPGSDVVMWGLYGTKYTQAGKISFYPAEDAQGLLPEDQEGLAVDHGRVWVKSMEVDGKDRGRKYLHASANSVALINDSLNRLPWVTKAGQEELLQSLEIRWGR